MSEESGFRSGGNGSRGVLEGLFGADCPPGQSIILSGTQTGVYFQAVRDRKGISKNKNDYPLDNLGDDPEFRDYSDPEYMHGQFEMYKVLGEKPENIKDENVRNLYMHWLSKRD